LLLSTVSMGRDRRTAPRIRLQSDAIAYLADRQQVCKAVDLSATGMLLFAPLGCSAGTRLRLVFMLPGTGQWLDLQAELVRPATGEGPGAAPRGCGVRFAAVPFRLAALLRSYVALRSAPEV